MTEFEDDDAGYMAWVKAYPDGLVLNVRRKPDPTYVVLHRASCGYISTERHKAGAYTGRGYRKICSHSMAELRNAARREGNHDGSFSNICNCYGK